MLERHITDPLEQQAMMRPKYPVNAGTDKEQKIVKKLMLDPNGHSGYVYVTRQDLEGNYDFQVDVETMSVNSDEKRKQARQTIVSLLVTNPNVSALLQQDGTRPKFKSLLVSWLEELGWTDADRYFEAIPQNPMGAMPGQEGAPGQPPMPGQPGATPPAQGQTPPAPSASASPQLVTPFGYYNYAPANDLQGVPVQVANKYRQGPLSSPSNQ